MSQALVAFTLVAASMLCADAAPDIKPSERLTSKSSFTGRIVGDHVRMRSGADLESHIVRELKKGDLIVVTGETGDFYVVEPPSDIEGYVFRSFVIDNVIEGSRVNVRLAPDKEAPIIGHLNTGDSIDGAICDTNSKWMKITSPKGTRFYIAKEFIEYAGKPDLKRIQDKRRSAARKLIESANMLVQTEMRKPFSDIAYDRMVQNYKTILSDYSEFPEETQEAKQALTAAQEAYIQKKIAFLEQKAGSLAEGTAIAGGTPQSFEGSLTDRMKMWEPIEQSLYLTWSSMHHSKTMDDFYAEERLNAHTIAGILEPFLEPVKNKPGNYLLKDQQGVIQAFLYSTHVDLNDFTGQSVHLTVSDRPNNNFAFPAYYVLGAE